MPHFKPNTIIPDAVEDAIITAAALTDEDNQPWTDTDFARAAPYSPRPEKTAITEQSPSNSAPHSE